MFAFSSNKIKCANPKMVEPMVFFMVKHIPWNLKPILVPWVHIPKVVKLLKAKVAIGMAVLEPSNAQYSNRWFTGSKKTGHSGSHKTCSR